MILIDNHLFSLYRNKPARKSTRYDGRPTIEHATADPGAGGPAAEAVAEPAANGRSTILPPTASLLILYTSI